MNTDAKVSEPGTSSSTAKQVAVKKIKRRKLIANVSRSKYDIGEVDDRAALIWMDTGVTMETVMNLEPWQRINHFPGMSEICRKDLLARNLNRMRKLFPKDYNFYPKTWWLPQDYADLVSYAKQPGAGTFIAKPDASSQGRGIVLFQDPLKTDFITSETNDLIVQKYVDRPFLLDGKKFDFRVYVLVSSCEPLEAYIYTEGLARFAVVPYAKPSGKNLSNLCMHLTNYAINKSHQQFDWNENGSKRSMKAVFETMRQQGYDTDKVWRNMKDAIVKTLLVGQPFVERFYKSSSRSHINLKWMRAEKERREKKVAQSKKKKSKKPEMPEVEVKETADAQVPGSSVPDERLSQCFEVLGFDVMLDHNLKPWILEVNHSPSLTCDAEIDERIKQALLTDTMHVLSMNGMAGRELVRYHRRRLRAIRKKKISTTNEPNSVTNEANYVYDAESSDHKKDTALASNESLAADGGDEMVEEEEEEGEEEPQDAKPTISKQKAKVLRLLEKRNLGDFETLYHASHMSENEIARYKIFLDAAYERMAIDKRSTKAMQHRQKFIEEQKARAMKPQPGTFLSKLTRELAMAKASRELELTILKANVMKDAEMEVEEKEPRRQVSRKGSLRRDVLFTPSTTNIIATQIKSLNTALPPPTSYYKPVRIPKAPIKPVQLSVVSLTADDIQNDLAHAESLKSFKKSGSFSLPKIDPAFSSANGSWSSVYREQRRLSSDSDIMIVGRRPSTGI